MTEQTPRNLFRYPIWLTPEASFIVRRHEPVYAVLIPLWLQARHFLPVETTVYGIMPGVDQCAVALLCEAPLSFRGKWQKISDVTIDVIDCCNLGRDFPGADKAMPALNAFIQQSPHLRYVEAGPLTNVLDTQTLAWLMEKQQHAHR